VPDATFTIPDLTTFTGLDDLGLHVTGQLLQPDQAVLACRVIELDDRCRRCGCHGVACGTVIRRLAHEPFGWRPTTLRVRVRRYRCTGCGHVWRQNTAAGAAPREKLSRGGLRWALEAVVCQHLTIARVAEALAVSWNCANDAVLAEGRRVLIEDPARLDGVTTIGVDEHVWRHTRRGDKYVTVIVDLTPIRCGTGPARLLDMVEGRSKSASKTWLSHRSQEWREAVEVVAMDGFTGFKTAAGEEVPDAVAVMDPFHVVRLGGDAVDEVRRRRQQELHHRRGRVADPLYRARRLLHTGADLLTASQQARLNALFTGAEHGDDHVEVEATWGVYQQMIAGLPAPRPARRQDGDECAHRLPRQRRACHATRAAPPGWDPEPPRCGRPGLLRPSRHQQRTHRGHQRPPRTPPGLRPGLPQPHELHRTIPAGDRRVQTPTTPQS